jgi:glycosyltransferase involved in cell wall biosynthesis
MEIHQFVATARPGDAVTNLAFEYRALLRRIGPSEIVAEYCDPALDGEVLGVEAYRRRPPSPANLVLYHASIGSRDLVELLLGRPERLGVVYHNITPARFFTGWSPVLERLCREGREELALLLRRSVVAIAASRFNAAELEELGGPAPHVVPPVLDPARLAGVASDPAVAAALAGRRGPHFVHVGQVMPHKRPEQLVQAFHLLVSHLHPDATLAIIGSRHLAPFVAAVERQVAELNLDGCEVLGSVPDAALAAHLRRADAFVTASEHEGFCVPLLEAMALDTPAVAKAVAAVPETAGGAALLLPPDAGPELLAEAMAVLAERPEVAAGFVHAGRERVRRVAAEDPGRGLLEALAEVV